MLNFDTKSYQNFVEVKAMHANKEVCKKVVSIYELKLNTFLTKNIINS